VSDPTHIIQIRPYPTPHESPGNILRDRVTSNNLTLFKWTSNDIICGLDDNSLDFFCFNILPQIRDNIESLNIEVLSIKRVLQATTYLIYVDLVYSILIQIQQHIYFIVRSSMFSYLPMCLFRKRFYFTYLQK
jgi:hypothetical protein